MPSSTSDLLGSYASRLCEQPDKRSNCSGFRGRRLSRRATERRASAMLLLLYCSEQSDLLSPPKGRNEETTMPIYWLGAEGLRFIVG